MQDSSVKVFDSKSHGKNTGELANSTSSFDDDPSVLQASESNGVRSFRYKVISIQVDSTQIEVVSRHHQSRFDTRRKSIRFKSTFMSSTV